MNSTNILSISVVIPIYNSEETIRQCIESVRASFSTISYQIIAVDDGSVDRSSQIVASLLSGPDRYLYQPNSGVARARNLGLAAASGSYILFLDSDDMLLPSYEVELLKIFHPNVGMYSFAASYQLHNRCTLTNSDHHLFKPLPLPFRIRILNPLTTSGMLIKSSLITQIGYFRPDFSPSEDWDYWIRASTISKYIRHIPKPCVLYNAVTFGISKSMDLRSAQLKVSKQLYSYQLSEHIFRYLSTRACLFNHSLEDLRINRLNLSWSSFVLALLLFLKHPFMLPYYMLVKGTIYLWNPLF